MPKGKYTVQLSIKAKGGANYKAKSITVKTTISVK